MIRSQRAWTALIAELSSIAPEKCESIIADLSFTLTRSVDLHVNPFIPLGLDANLAVAPQFPLHSQMEENILRVCSILRPGVYDALSDEKEKDMRLDLRRRLKHRNVQGPVMMPKPTPDIDLLVTEETSSTLVIAELKWYRKSLAPKEIPGKDDEVLKGISQLRKIRRFLLHNPSHLTAQKKLLRKVSDYEHIYYLLIPRDHWPWFEPTQEIAIVEFEAFAKVMEKSEDLISAIRLLLTYEWLPVEGRNFTVRYERATANGVSIESQIFYAT